MFINTRPSENVAVLATLDPASVAASTVTTGWVNAGLFLHIMALIQTGVLGASATVDAKLQQATDSSGTGAKDVTGKKLTQIVKASGDNKQAIINLKPQELDVSNGFNYVRLSLTVGTAASLVGAVVVGMIARYGSCEQFNQAATAQVVE